MVRLIGSHVGQITAAVSENMVRLSERGLQAVLIAQAVLTAVFFQREPMQGVDGMPVDDARFVH